MRFEPIADKLLFAPLGLGQDPPLDICPNQFLERHPFLKGFRSKWIELAIGVIEKDEPIVGIEKCEPFLQAFDGAAQAILGRLTLGHFTGQIFGAPFNPALKFFMGLAKFRLDRPAVGDIHDIAEGANDPSRFTSLKNGEVLKPNDIAIRLNGAVIVVLEFIWPVINVALKLGRDPLQIVGVDHSRVADPSTGEVIGIGPEYPGNVFGHEFNRPPFGHGPSENNHRSVREHAFVNGFYSQPSLPQKRAKRASGVYQKNPG